MIDKLATPDALFTAGLLILATALLMLMLAKAEFTHSRFVFGRTLVWLLVLVSVLPVTVDELSRGRSSDLTATLLDDQLGPVATNVSRGMQIALVLVAWLAIQEALSHGARGASLVLGLFLLVWFCTVLSAVDNSWAPKPIGLMLPLIGWAVFASSRAGAPLLAELRRVLLAIVVVSLAMYVLAPSLATLSGTRSPDSDPRLAGVFSQPNGMGAAAAASLLLLLATTAGAYRVVTMSIAGVALILADSRTALFAVALCVPILLIAPHARRRRGPDQARQLLVTLGSLLAGFVVFQSLLHGSTNVSTLNGRTLIWEYVTQEWQTHPLLGAGPDGWTAARLLANVPLYAGQAHNEFFDTLYLFGVTGVIALVALLGYSLRGASRLWREGSPIPLAMLVCLVITGVSESPFKFDVTGVSAEGAIALVVLASVQVVRSRDAHSTDFGATAFSQPAFKGLSDVALI